MLFYVRDKIAQLTLMSEFESLIKKNANTYEDHTAQNMYPLKKTLRLAK